MATIEKPVRFELLDASDEAIEDAVNYGDPMVLRGLVYQLTGDPELAAAKVILGPTGPVPATEEDMALIRRKAAEFLKGYRDAGAGEIEIGPQERLPVSIDLVGGAKIPEEDVGLWLEDLALDPFARGLKWQALPSPEQLHGFSVTIIGSGMGGLNAAVQLKQAGIQYRVIEKNSGVGGTWYENRYPGARADTLSRGYTHLYGVDFGYPDPFCAAAENVEYFNWVADTFNVRDDIEFDTEVRSMTWDEESAMWEILVDGPEGERTIRSNAVITAVGFLNRPNLPEIEGMADFAGLSWHTVRWPQGTDLHGKRFAVIGTGATGYQMIPELALEAEHVTVFQRTPQWLIPTPGYRSPTPPQVTWLDRNLPFHTNFMRFRAVFAITRFDTMNEIDPNFDDPYSVNAINKGARDACVAFIEQKLGDPELVAKMTPPHPVLSARRVIVDPEYSVLDAIQRDNVTLVTDGIRRINRTGIEDTNGTQHDVDVIVYATGFHATEYLFPMKITGRGGQTIEELWAKDGARAYVSCMMPGFPNLWSVYGPNSNGSLQVASFHELVGRYAMECMERLILDHKRSIEVKEDAYWRYNELLDERNRRKVWNAPKANSYYWTKSIGRSAVMNPFTAAEMWHYLRHPDLVDLEIR
jgi:4-hydroxyacetophenone monooxygenase